VAAANNAGRSRAPSVQADPRINALVVQDTPDRLPIYERLIAQLDVPSPLIEIEALIIDVSSDRMEELGIAWGGRFGRTAAGYGNLTPPADGNSISIARASSGMVNPTTVLVDAGNYLVSRIRALEGVGDARIQASPSVLTIDNVGALLDLSQTFYIQTTGERVANVTPVTAGTTLRVTPHYIQKGDEPSVELTVDIEDGQILSTGQNGQLPTVTRSTVSTQAIVGDNQTLLIGGYNSSQYSEQVNRVPVLGSIPILGALFSNTSHSNQRRERLFLIRPKIISVPMGEVASKAPELPPTTIEPAWPGAKPGKPLGRLDRPASSISAPPVAYAPAVAPQTAAVRPVPALAAEAAVVPPIAPPSVPPIAPPPIAAPAASAAPLAASVPNRPADQHMPVAPVTAVASPALADRGTRIAARDNRRMPVEATTAMASDRQMVGKARDTMPPSGKAPLRKPTKTSTATSLVELFRPSGQQGAPITQTSGALAGEPVVFGPSYK
jgi:type III secretion protein C